MAKPSVLIVEDEPDIADLIRFHCEREGMDARTVGTGKVAIELVKREVPDLMILDLMLPDVGGIEVCRRVKQWPESREMPVVMVTAKGEETDIVAGLEIGADDYVVKPFSPRVLMARVRAVLRRRAELQETTLDNRLERLEGKLVIDPDRHVVAANGSAGAGGSKGCCSPQWSITTIVSGLRNATCAACSRRSCGRAEAVGGSQHDRHTPM